MRAISSLLKKDPLLLAGPICLLLTLSVSMQIPSTDFSVPWIAPLGLALIWIFALRGFGISLLIMGCWLAFSHFTYWDLGIYTSLVAGWLATALAIEENTSFCEQKGEVKTVDPQPLLEAIEQQKGEISAQQSLLERLRQELIGQIDKNGKLQESEKQLRNLVEIEKKEKTLSFEKLELQQQLVSEIETQLGVVQSESNNFRQNSQKYKGLYDQLREQFDAKQTQLDTARQTLFAVEEELSRLQKESWEKECSLKTPWINDLEKLLEHSEHLYQEEIAHLKAENQLLEEVIDATLISAEIPCLS